MPIRTLPLTPAERQREYRRRLRERVCIVPHKVWPCGKAALIKAGWLSKAEAQKKAAVIAAVSDMFDCWVRGTLKPDPTQQGPR